MDRLTSVLVRLQGLFSRIEDDEGQTLAEYSLLITIISVAVVTLAVISFRTTLVEAWESASDCLSALGTCSS